jgi:hypothetical protein
MIEGSGFLGTELPGPVLARQSAGLAILGTHGRFWTCLRNRSHSPGLLGSPDLGISSGDPAIGGAVRPQHSTKRYNRLVAVPRKLLCDKARLETAVGHYRTGKLEGFLDNDDRHGA